MKKTVKRLALLLAGLMLSATLVACDSAYTGSDDDDDDDDSQSSSRYKNLDPEEVLEALLEADEFTVTREQTYVSGETDSNTLITLMKNGSKMRYNEKAQGDDQRYETNQYANMETGLIYVQEYDGADWSVQSEEIDLEDILEDNGFSDDLLLDNETYGEYDADNNRYPMKSSALKDAIGDDEDLTVEGYRTVKGSTYTFYVSVSNGEYTGTYTFTVKFTADKITLPEAESVGNEGVAIPDVKED